MLRNQKWLDLYSRRLQLHKAFPSNEFFKALLILIFRLNGWAYEQRLNLYYSICFCPFSLSGLLLGIAEIVQVVATSKSNKKDWAELRKIAAEGQ